MNACGIKLVSMLAVKGMAMSKRNNIGLAFMMAMATAAIGGHATGVAERAAAPALPILFGNGFVSLRHARGRVPQIVLVHDRRISTQTRMH